MAQAEMDAAGKSLVARLVPRRKRWRFFVSLVLFLLLVALYGWIRREQLANDIIAGTLAEYDLPGEYEIVSIGPERQVLTDVVIGDPKRPDLTIERVEVALRYRFGTPAVGRVTLLRPRLFGKLAGGAVSFGSLDKVIHADSDAPSGLPGLDLELIDGRALIESEYGSIGVKAEGKGALDHGFEGVLAATAPELDAGGCAIRDVSLYGRVGVTRGTPNFVGPLRLSQLACPKVQARWKDAAAILDISMTPEFDRAEGRARVSSGALAIGSMRGGGIGGSIRTVYGENGVDARYTLTGRDLALPQVTMATVTADGSFRSRDGFDRLELQTDIEGQEIRLGDVLDASLANAGLASQGTLLTPILSKIRSSLQREARGSRLLAELTVRKKGDVVSLVSPSARLRGGSGAALLSASRVRLSTIGGASRFSGNLSTGGEGLPKIAGRLERRSNGRSLFRLRMAEYRAGDSLLAIPEISLAQSQGGAIGFAGDIVASGALPGGGADMLRIPVSGMWSSGNGLSLWRKCIEIGFRRLAYAQLELENRALTLCPGRSGAIARINDDTVRIAAGIPGLDLAGKLADTPMSINTGPVGFAYPGVMTARELDVMLGPVNRANRFRISGIDALLGNELSGSFTGAEAMLDAVPLDLRDASGNWRYADGVFTLAEGVVTVEDREIEHRFEPLIARDAILRLADNIVTAAADLREPDSDRIVTAVDIRHNVSTGTGHADLRVDGLRFDDALQPDELTYLAEGVVANVKGMVAGTGRIDWNEKDVTSSGEFSSESLDLAAAFGPVRDASGTIAFTDLLGLTTAPRQTLRIGSVNPGIEVLDGEIRFALRDGRLLSVEDGTWPFMGGRLILEKVDLNVGVSEARRYVFRIEGLDGAQFVEQTELGNLRASGIFDGRIPIVFDEIGNGVIQGGTLNSRTPGGNVSYVGELIYEDLSPIANFAFSALSSLDYETMSIAMDGPLTGEIVTRVRFDGVSQGAGTDRNFITRQIADLPIRFNVNIRAPFYKLIGSFKAIYDPALVRDPRDLGLLTDDGTRLRETISGEGTASEIDTQDLTSDESAIQHQESETLP